MIITEEEQLLSDNIISAFCSHLGVNIEDVYKKHGTQQVKKARNFALYVLHTEHKLSIKKLSMLYNTVERNVNHKIAKIRFLIEHDTLYKQLHKELRECLNKE